MNIEMMYIINWKTGGDQYQCCSISDRNYRECSGSFSGDLIAWLGETQIKF